MREDAVLGVHIRKILDEGCDQLDGQIVVRLQQARGQAIAAQRLSVVSHLGLAGVGSLQIGRVLPYLRTGAALGALMIGMIGSYYWNAYQEAADNEEIDSALLSADLPVAAYTDQGFHAWLSHSSQE